MEVVIRLCIDIRSGSSSGGRDMDILDCSKRCVLPKQDAVSDMELLNWRSYVCFDACGMLLVYKSVRFSLDVLITGFAESVSRR